MPTYEITYLTKEEDKEKIVPKLIEELQGKVLDWQDLGQKRLAYHLKKQTAAYIYTISFEMENDKVLDLNKEINLQSDILRHLILTKEVVAKVPKVSEKVEEAIEEAISKQKKVPKAVKAKAKEAITPEIKETKEDEKERMKKLEKSLEEILKE